MSGYFLGIDQGTTLTTAVLTDERMRIVAKASKGHETTYPKPGWVEQNPEEIYENCKAVAAEVLEKAGAKPEELIALGLDNQGETCCIWEKDTGKPIYNAIVWQDRRTADFAAELEREKGGRIREISGLRPDPYFSATKFRWILDNVPGARKRMEKGELLLGTLNSYIFWMLTGGEVYKTDAGTAACTMLMDVRKLSWSPELMETVGISAEQMAEICDTSELYGMTKPECFLGVSVPIGGSAGDSPSSIIGGGCMGEGILKTSYGTGCFMTLQTGEKLVISEQGLVSDCMYRVEGRPQYRLRGACYVAGAAVEWLRDGLGIIDSPAETESLARSISDTGDLFFVPAFAGLATPFWDPYARGAFIGLTGGAGRAHLVRAVLESIAYQVAYCYRSMTEEMGKESPSMRADGGITDNGFVMQLQADMLGIPVEIPKEKETAAFGAACIAATTMGALPSFSAVRDLVEIKACYEPKMTKEERDERLSRWVSAVQRTLGWAKEDATG